MSPQQSAGDTPANAATPTTESVAALGAALRGFWRLAGPYWHGTGRRRAWGLTLALGAATLSNALLQLRLNVWLGDFFNAIDSHARGAVISGVLIFVLLAVGLMSVGAILIWLKAAMQIGWRTWMTDHLVDRWLEHGHGFLIRLKGDEYDNPDHRIAEDVRMVAEAAVDFAAGLMNSCLLLVIFIGALWALSGTITIGWGKTGMPVPGYLVFAAIGYAAVSTTITHLLGHPLIKLSEARHAREGDFRFTLVRVRENAEGIALLHGQAVERSGLRRVFGRLVDAFRAQMRLESRLTLATTCFTVVNPVLPLLIASPQYLSGDITLGNLMQISQAFVQVQVALGFFVDNYARLSDWMAGINRIVRLDEACAEHDAATVQAGRIERRTTGDHVLRFVGLSVSSPEGEIVIDGATTVVAAGERVLISGNVGIGKTTLFRAIAGLWPWGKGAIELPEHGQTMFMPHRPYVPSGTLRTALTYPGRSDDFADATVVAALERCGLERLKGKLDVEARWDQMLSEAEQQRLAFARLVLHRPAWVVMDEATSELDEAAEAELMGLFGSELAGTTLVTLAQRSSLRRFHDRMLALTQVSGTTHLVKAPVLRDDPPSPDAQNGPLTGLWRRIAPGSGAIPRPIDPGQR
jgi:vitamin B12/bleomycin/antimicrobial peptide transport system ATP-binding/permease protein